jgi:hypothetical protein
MNCTLADFTPNDIKLLAASEAFPSLSILMPTHQAGPETTQGPIRLKNLLKKAGQLLKERGKTDSLLQPLSEKLDDESFWQHQGAGLAIYASSDSCQMLRLPFRVDEKVVVEDRYYLKPLVAADAPHGEYFTLALSWDEATLYRVAGKSWEKVKTSQLPATFAELTREPDPEEQIQFTTHQKGRETTAMYHGQGEGEDSIEADRNLYLSRVGAIINSETYNSNLPMVLVGTDEVVGHFQAASQHEPSAKVSGSPAEFSDEELREEAANAVAPLFDQEREGFAERFGTAASQSEASTDLTEVIQAAMQGRVDSVMVNSSTEVWGNINTEKQTIEMAEGETGVDLTNAAIVETIRTGGEAYATTGEQMPQNAAVAAIFRY